MKKRNATLDYARLVAAFGIVIFHAGAPGAPVGYAALPFFLILLVALAVPSASKMPFATYASGRAQRLLLPWLVWSAVYTILKLAELAVTGAPPSSEFAPYMLFTGPALHLWFLPFAFAACLAIPLLSWLAHLNIALTSIGLLGLGLAVLVLRQDHVFTVPYAQWLYALPAACLGIALALSGDHPRRMGILAGGFIISALLVGATSGLLQITLAAGAFILCTVWRLPEVRFSRLAGNASMGVYLAHPIILSLLERTTTLSKGSLSYAVIGSLGALAVALVIIWCGSKLWSSPTPGTQDISSNKAV